MSQEKVFKVLSDLGLTRLDSKIYIYLAKNGPKEGKEISRALKVQRPQLYRSLKTLQKKAIVSATLERPAKFSAVSFERAVNLFIRTKLEEAQKKYGFLVVEEGFVCVIITINHTIWEV